MNFSVKFYVIDINSILCNRHQLNSFTFLCVHPTNSEVLTR